MNSKAIPLIPVAILFTLLLNCHAQQPPTPSAPLPHSQSAPEASSNVEEGHLPRASPQRIVQTGTGESAGPAAKTALPPQPSPAQTNTIPAIISDQQSVPAGPPAESPGLPAAETASPVPVPASVPTIASVQPTQALTNQPIQQVFSEKGEVGVQQGIEEGVMSDAELAQFVKDANVNAPMEGNLNDEKLAWGDVEEKMDKEEEKEEKDQLYGWISQQMESNVFVGEGVVTETFQVVIGQTKAFNFRWNPPKSQTLHIKIMVFEMEADGGLMIMRDNEEEEFIEVSSREEGHTTYRPLGKVYIDRTILFNFDTDYKYFKLHNHINKPVMVIVDIEKLQEIASTVGAVHNDQFTLSVNKLEAIKQEVVSGEKLRDHSYKYQWGFLENQYSHDSRLLGFTALELVVMIVAALVQVYFIKSLVDNRAIV